MKAHYKLIILALLFQVFHLSPAIAQVPPPVPGRPDVRGNRINNGNHSNSPIPKELPATVNLDSTTTNALRNGKILLNFESADIRTVAKLISEITNKNIIMDPRVQGKITILSAQEVTPAEAWKMFVSALNTYGFDVVDWGKTAKIISRKNVPAEKSKFYTEDGVARNSDEFLVAVIGLKNADPTHVANVLKPLCSPDIGIVVPYPPSRSILVADDAYNVKRLIKITRHLDTARQKPVVKTFYLNNAVSSDVVKALERLYPQRENATAVITDYPSYNAVIVMGTSQIISDIEALLVDMDRRLERRNVRKFQVIQLQNANAEEVAKILSDMLREGQQAERRTSTTTAPATTRPAGYRPPGERPGQQPAVENWPAAGTVETADVGTAAAQEPEFVSTKVAADKETNSIILYVTDPELEIIRPMITQLDAQRKQVLITAIIAEVSEKFTKTAGANWQVLTDSGFGAAFGGGKSQEALFQLLSSGNFILGGIGNRTTEINVGGRIVKFPNVFSLIQFLNEDNNFRILSTPRVLTLDHKEAVMNVGSIIPFASGIKFDANGQPIITYDYKDVGLNLTVTPHIGQGELIRLKVDQKVQDVTDYIQQNLGAIGYVVPVVSTRNVNTNITLGDSQTVIIGGLVSRRLVDSIKKVPILGDIPILGAAFRNKRQEIQKTTLFIFLTPHVVDDPRQLTDLTEKYQHGMKEMNSDTVKTDVLQQRR